jgi:hypothetical protein
MIVEILNIIQWIALSSAGWLAVYVLLIGCNFGRWFLGKPPQLTKSQRAILVTWVQEYLFGTVCATQASSMLAREELECPGSNVKTWNRWSKERGYHEP